MVWRQSRWDEPLITEMSRPGRRGALPPRPGEDVVKAVGPIQLPRTLARDSPPSLPEVSEVEVVRHYTRLSQMAYGVDNGPIPLGSCTMKYNPRVAARLAFDPRLETLHPLQDDETVQGVLEAIYMVQEWLKHITGMDACTVHPAAGSQGELAGVLMIKRFHEIRGELDKRRVIIVPDSAHGTNPASAAMGGFQVVEVPTGDDGNVDMEALKAALGGDTAGLMITNPSTLGLFEENILDIARLVHEAGGLLYYDGANLNGIIGRARPGDMEFDIAHVNLHKTFSVPHGGGGPGSGPVCVRRVEAAPGVTLEDLLPGPRVVYSEDEGLYRVRPPGRWSVGRLRAWIANTLAVLWAYVYILAMGPQGLRLAGEVAVVNTNYFIKLMEGHWGYSLPYAPGRPRKHEAVLSAKPLKRETGATAEDVAKGLLDAGLYAPTIYFPLIVEEALMIEFTESETKENIEAYAARLKEIAEEARRDPSTPKKWPRNTSSARVDNVRANHPRTVTPTWRVEVLRRQGRLGPLR
ncbi:glycine dehydrogenase subunit 2 [Aeropyrum camini SY1 = JCM 12091]|uniref:Probable glycine dehydrogenase (decarboxylating) subunit 2 n=1 Tax=Aeropyrum camini SY1 = JCM 12091 TaxID=1198449 RepID=U3TEC8_9CREN|nr:glycine dehydrogenase subunit 2 [Aeropyrum camini SY1 = JCM 12091]